MKRKLPKPTVELPKSFDLTSRCREHTELALSTLISVLKSTKAGPNAKIKAAQEILNRAYGKAPIVIDVTQHLDTDALASAASAILEERRRKMMVESTEMTPPIEGARGVGVGSGSLQKSITSPKKVNPLNIREETKDGPK